MTTESLFPGAPEALDADAVGGTNRKTLFVAVGVAAALALGGGGYFLLSGGGSSSSSPSAAPVVHFGHQGAPKAPVAAPAQVTHRVVLPAVYKGQIGRDPFKPQYVAPPAPTSTGAGASGTTSTPTSTSTSTTTSTSSGSTSTAAAPPPAQKVHTLILTRVYGSGSDRTAVFSIDGKTQLAKVGSVFGPVSEIKLLSFTQTSKGWTCTIQVGDADPFDVGIGQKAYVN